MSSKAGVDNTLRGNIVGQSVALETNLDEVMVTALELLNDEALSDAARLKLFNALNKFETSCASLYLTMVW